MTTISMMNDSSRMEMKEQEEDDTMIPPFSLKQRSAIHVSNKDIEVEIEELQEVIKVMLEKERHYVCDQSGCDQQRLYESRRCHDNKQFSYSPVTVAVKNFSRKAMISNEERYEVRIDFVRKLSVPHLFLDKRISYLTVQLLFFYSIITGCKMDVQGKILTIFHFELVSDSLQSRLYK